jgi:FeS assembly SUF system regulator
MIKLGKLTDYAVVIAAKLSQEGLSVSRSAHYLSEKTGIPEPTVAKVLKQLTKGQIVQSVRGATGGYHLARPADTISIAEIVVAMDGPISIVSCAGESNELCKAEVQCPVKGNWEPVNRAMKAALENVKLSDMAAVSCGQAYDFLAAG